MISEAEAERILATEHINIQVLTFPCSSPDEQVVLNHDDSYTILLNDRCDCYQKHFAMLHALEHIKNGDFYKCDVQAIEYEAHGAYS